MEKMREENSPYLCAYLVFQADQINRLISVQRATTTTTTAPKKIGPRKCSYIDGCVSLLFFHDFCGLCDSIKVPRLLSCSLSWAIFIPRVHSLSFSLPRSRTCSTFGECCYVVYACVHFDRFNQINNNPMHSLKVLWPNASTHPLFFCCSVPHLVLFFYLVGNSASGFFSALIFGLRYTMGIFDYVQLRSYANRVTLERLWPFLLLANKRINVLDDLKAINVCVCIIFFVSYVRFELYHSAKSFLILLSKIRQHFSYYDEAKRETKNEWLNG